MKGKLYGLLALVLVAGLVGAGCGDDEEETTGGGNGGTPPAATTPSGGGTGGADPNDPRVRQAVESCKRSITAAPQLQADTKKELEKICDEAAEGDANAVREAAKKVCLKIVEDTVPAGPARSQAEQACERAGATP